MLERHLVLHRDGHLQWAHGMKSTSSTDLFRSEDSPSLHLEKVDMRHQLLQDGPLQ
jgi:hypothetical protein